MHAAIGFSDIEEAAALKEIFTDDEVMSFCASRLGERWKTIMQKWKTMAGQPTAVLGSRDLRMYIY